MHLEPLTIEQHIQALCQAENALVSVDPNYGKNYTVSAMFRGKISMVEAEKHVESIIFNGEKKLFTDWLEGFKSAHID